MLSSTDKKNYASGEKPVLTLTVTNAGTVPCVLNVGTSQQEFTVTSGNDRVFSTTDCLAKPSDVNLEIAAGKSETAKFTWDRVRSTPGCSPVNAKPSPGTYVFTAKLGDVESNRSVFDLD
ncbi:hypothetical protein HD598_001375 [Neomicrococcus aestuarii]|uniref:Intracellular proteinase inhibitor BsuPI domain-containing protein n=1 Tax=Neomicrococcus aestuarii TaxID=556325 RepID=A0A7W8X0A8_9MICC|nr:hypothetical protein [Neomicrococcus aestuarii]MBB5512688.1 hypothetical protein [Neomicrococcus aestuarii]